MAEHAFSVDGRKVVVVGAARSGLAAADLLRKRGARVTLSESRASFDEAAALAAFYSKGKEAASVEVMYTQAKYVRKFRGARPGQVQVTEYRTLQKERKVAARRLDTLRDDLHRAVEADRAALAKAIRDV